MPTFSLESNEWALLSIPADPGPTGSPAELFGDDLPIDDYGSPGSWVLFGYDSAAGSYTEIGPEQPLAPNVAYWMIQVTGAQVVIDVPDTLSPLAGSAVPGCPQGASCAQVPLAGDAGELRWSLAGASTEQPIGFGDTRFVGADSECAGGCTPAQSAASGVTAGTLFRYQSSGDESGYEAIGTGQTLQPWEGYWVATLGAASGVDWLLPVGDDAGGDVPDPGDEGDREPSTTRDASRLLTQATFGATESEIQEVLEIGGPAAWIDAQLALEPTFHLPMVRRLFPNADGRQAGRYQTFWDRALRADDQLRQRFAFALSEIFVISDNSGMLSGHGSMVAAYQDILLTHAFGNYRDLLRAVTLSPAMGVYLSMLDNEKPDPETGQRADENYAREVMQLFTIGLETLNLDGSSRGSAPTYEQPDVENLARAFTGWSWDGPDWRSRPRGTNAEAARLRERPMKAFPEYHDTDEKSFLGSTLPAGQSPEQDLEAALDIIFNHPNVGPFISKQLIQRLVTSNPSSGYVSRVASIFNDNGEGERGDLAAVLKAILLDSEARDDALSDGAAYGKLREPLLRFSHLWRAFDVSEDITMNRGSKRLAPQVAPMTAPSVFNFFSPQYQPQGRIKQASLVAPEFQINSESAANAVNDGLMRSLLRDRFYFQFPVTLDVSRELQLLDTPEALLEHLDLVLLSGSMSESLRSVLLDYMASNADTVEEERLVRDVIGLVITSPDHAIQR